MDFGKVPDISVVDFSIPPDGPLSAKVLAQAKKQKKKPQVYVGCAKWGRPDWVGKLYPKGTKQADFLAHYTRHFNCIELNAMFYRLFPKATVEGWAAKADDSFRFCPKFTNIITHIRRLKNAEKETDAYLDTVSAFGNKLGCSFIQLDDRFGPKQEDSIKAYLKSLPRDFEVALELRHTDWYNHPAASQQLFGLMAELGISSIITDTAGRRDVMHMQLTTPTAFIRYVGNSLHKTDYERIDAWIDRIDYWLESGLQNLYFFIHQHDELYSPELSHYMITRLNKKCNLQVKLPGLINNYQPPLF